MSVGLSVYSGSSNDASGYLLVRVDGEDSEGVGPRFVAAHRLAAVAWGVLDGLADDREVHHIDGCPLHNSETNLDAHEPERHGRITAEQVRKRRGEA